MYFVIKLNPISKKNSQQILVNKSTGKPFIMPSQKYVDYERQAMRFLPKISTIDYSVNVKCLFYMPTHRKCDLTNLLEAIDDIMVKAGLLEDDNFTIVAGHDGSRVLYDKDNPRTEVTITPIDNDENYENKIDKCEKKLIEILTMPEDEFQKYLKSLE